MIAGIGDQGLGGQEGLKKMNIEHRTSNIEHRIMKSLCSASL